MRQYGAISPRLSTASRIPVSTFNPGPIATPKPAQRLGKKALWGLRADPLLSFLSSTAAEGPIVSSVLAIALKGVGKQLVHRGASAVKQASGA